MLNKEKINLFDFVCSCSILGFACTHEKCWCEHFTQRWMILCVCTRACARVHVCLSLLHLLFLQDPQDAVEHSAVPPVASQRQNNTSSLHSSGTIRRRFFSRCIEILLYVKIPGLQINPGSLQIAQQPDTDVFSDPILFFLFANRRTI